MTQSNTVALTTQWGFLTVTREGPAPHDDVTFSFFGDDGSEAFIAIPAWKLADVVVTLGLATVKEG